MQESASVATPQRPGFVTVDNYLKLPRAAETYLIKPLIPAGGSCLLYGAPKLGKSYLGIQIAAALAGMSEEWFGFPVKTSGPVCYLQLDTPRSAWAERFAEMVDTGGLKYNDNLRLADRETIPHYPFDILQPLHVAYLYALVREHDPIAVVVDTIREAHSGDEDNSTIMRNVIANLVYATHPAALILVSHSRKTSADLDKDLMDDHRGSSYVTGRMDSILRLTSKRLYYTGRSIESGDLKLKRLESGLWGQVVDETGPAIAKVLADENLSTMRAKARILAPQIGRTEEAAMSLLRRSLLQPVPPVGGGKVNGEIVLDKIGNPC